MINLDFPNGGYIDRTVNSNVTWTLSGSPSLNLTQTAYEPMYRIGTGNWQTLGKTTSSTKSFNLYTLYTSIGNSYKYDFREIEFRILVWYETSGGQTDPLVSGGQIQGKEYSKSYLISWHGHQIKTLKITRNMDLSAADQQKIRNWPKKALPPGLSNDWWDLLDWAELYKQITGAYPEGYIGLFAPNYTTLDLESLFPPIHGWESHKDPSKLIHIFDVKDGELYETCHNPTCTHLFSYFLNRANEGIDSYIYDPLFREEVTYPLYEDFYGYSGQRTIRAKISDTQIGVGALVYYNTNPIAHKLRVRDSSSTIAFIGKREGDFTELPTYQYNNGYFYGARYIPYYQYYTYNTLRNYYQYYTYSNLRYYYQYYTYTVYGYYYAYTNTTSYSSFNNVTRYYYQRNTNYWQWEKSFDYHYGSTPNYSSVHSSINFPSRYGRTYYVEPRAYLSEPHWHLGSYWRGTSKLYYYRKVTGVYCYVTVYMRNAYSGSWHWVMPSSNIIYREPVGSVAYLSTPIYYTRTYYASTVRSLYRVYYSRTYSYLTTRYYYTYYTYNTYRYYYTYYTYNTYRYYSTAYNYYRLNT